MIGARPETCRGHVEERTAAALPERAQVLVDRIGNTPLLPLPPVDDAAGVRILGKAEWLNPGGSVKDRPAWGMVRAALEDGTLPERILLDASSGNTAIAFAMLGAAVGFDVALCVPENASRERRRTLTAYGARVISTDPVEGMDGARRRAREMAAEDPGRFWYADQYGNAENWRAHYRGTGPEIWEQTGGEVTHVVAGLGTTGTLMGSARWLRDRRSDLRVVAVQPAEAFHGLEGLKHIPTVDRPEIYDESVVDETRRIGTEEAYETASRLASGEGLFVGPSSGAAYAAARNVAEGIDGGTVVTVLPDGGSRYLSDAWWEQR